MTKVELLAEMQSSYSAIEYQVESLTSEELVKIGVTSEWSMADLIAHLAGWLRLTLAKVAGTPLIDTKEGENSEVYWDRTNLRFIQEARKQQLPEVLDDFRASFHRLHVFVESTPESALFEQGIAATVRINSVEHLNDHLQGIVDWVTYVKSLRA